MGSGGPSRLPDPRDEETARINALLAKLAADAGQAAVPAGSPTEKFDALPVEQRVSQLGQLAEKPPTRGEDLVDFGLLAASLARSAPERLTADLLDRVAGSAPGARGFMRGVGGMAPAESAALLGGLPIASRKQLFDELGTDGTDLPHAEALVASLLQADPDLAAEAVAWGGQALARALATRFGDELADLPAGVRRAIERQAEAVTAAADATGAPSA